MHIIEILKWDKGDKSVLDSLAPSIRFGGTLTMCGIVGYTGLQDAKEILLKGLEKLEYRGYDSAGIAVKNEEGVTIFKEKGRIADLRTEVDEDAFAQTGIGHTRWATHGVPSQDKCTSSSKYIRSFYISS